MTTLLVAPRAEAQMRAIVQWWNAERPAAPELFALDTFWHDLANDVVEVLAVWHGARGRGPVLT